MHNDLAICHVIATVIAADGIIDEAERAFLEEAMSDLDLSEEEKTEVREFKSEGAEAVVQAMPMPYKQALRDGLVEATLADGNISPHETAVVKYFTDLMEL